MRCQSARQGISYVIYLDDILDILLTFLVPVVGGAAAPVLNTVGGVTSGSSPLGAVGSTVGGVASTVGGVAGSVPVVGGAIQGVTNTVGSTLNSALPGPYPLGGGVSSSQTTCPVPYINTASVSRFRPRRWTLHLHHRDSPQSPEERPLIPLWRPRRHRRSHQARRPRTSRRLRDRETPARRPPFLIHRYPRHRHRCPPSQRHSRYVYPPPSSLSLSLPLA